MILPDMLRSAIAQSHTEIEQTEAAKAMIGGTIDRDQYTALMAQMATLHDSLETLLAATTGFEDLYDATANARADVIRADLVALDAFGEMPAFDATATLTDSFEAWSTATPWKLIGALYVFEGSRMGSMALVRPVAKALGVDVRPGTGVDYHLDGIATRPMVWQKFKAQLASHDFADTQKAEITAAAVQTMQALQSLYEQATVTGDIAVL